MAALSNAPFIVVIGYVNGDVDYYGPFNSRSRANDYGTQAVVELKAQRFHVAELCRSFNDRGFEAV